MKKAIHTLSLVLLLLSFLPVSAIDDASWEALKEQARNRPRRLIYDNDGDDALYGENDNEKSVDKFMAQRTTYLAGSKFDTLIYCSSFAGFENPLCQDRPPEMVLPGTYCEFLYNQGTSPIQLQLDFARANNLEFFLSFRINDTHDAFTPWLLSKNKKAHPEWLFGLNSAQPLFDDWSSYNFAIPEVRALFVNSIRQMTEQYAVDGISIDIQRQSNLFLSVANGGMASDDELKMLVDMFVEIRQLTEEIGRQRERPLLIMLRIPDSVEYCRGIGLDIEALLGNGLVDLIVSTGNWRLNPWRYSVELCRKYGVKCYASMDCPEFNEVQHRLMRNSNEAQWARQAQALAAGCDGTFWFNRFYKSIVDVTALPDLEALKYKSKRYHLTDRFLYYTPETHLRNGNSYINLPFVHPSHPMELVVGKNYPLLLEIGDDTEALEQEKCQYDMEAIIKGRVPQPEKLQFTSNGKAWQYTGAEDGYLHFDLPTGALRKGENIINVCYQGEPVNAGPELLMLRGDAILSGANQPPWRRIFPEGVNKNGESIVDGAYRLCDAGEGYVNLIYPLPELKTDLHLKCDMKLEATSGASGVACRIADGRHVEVVEFTNDSIRCKFAGLATAFRTDDKFHEYEFQMSANALHILADGHELLAAPLVIDAFDPNGQLLGNTLQLTNSSIRSVLIGSLDRSGTGISLWKNLRCNRQHELTCLEDVAVEISISRKLDRRIVNDWRVSQPSAKAFFLNEHASWTADPLVAEFDVDLSKAPVRLAISRGASFTVIDVTPNAVTFPAAAHKPMAIKATDDNVTIAIQFDDTDRIQVFCGNACCEISDQNTTLGLQDAKYMELEALDKAILRNGGVIVLPSSDGIRHGQAISAIRARLFKDGE